VAILPEFIFRTVLVRGIRTIRNDTRLLDQLFRNLDQTSAQEMRTFFRTQAIYLDINYPRETLKLPAIVLLLRAESEFQAFVGDTMGYGDLPDAMSWDDLSDEDGVLGTAASISSMSGEGPIVFGPYPIASATANSIKADSIKWSINQFLTEPHTLHVVGGAGVGQTRGIIANGVNTISVKPNFSPALDNTSVFLIRSAAPEIVGEPRALYKRSNAKNVERLGGLYNLSYQLQVIGPNPEFTIYLASIVKSILTLARVFLEGQGIINMKMGATDFVPRTEYQPDFSYMRALTVDFQYPFDVFAELGDGVEQIKIAIETLCGTDGDIEIVSDTTI
jgi:hypothetical protein